MREKPEISVDALTCRIEDAISDLDKLSITIGLHDANYLKTYPVFIEWFDSHGAWKSPSVILGASLVYSWMPTTLKTVSNCSGVADLLNQFDQDISINGIMDFLNNTDRFVNRSWVGTSKFLHFFRPNIFPIIDSRIAATLGLQKSKISRERDIYQTYLAAIHSVDKTKKNKATAWALRNKLIPSNHQNQVRAIEIGLFYSGRN